MRRHLLSSAENFFQFDFLLPSFNPLQWMKLFGQRQQEETAHYGTLVTMPTEEPLVGEISVLDIVSAQRAIRLRMTAFFHILKVEHVTVRDLTLLTGWWRLDTADAPQYQSLRRPIQVDVGSTGVVDKSIRLSEEFLDHVKAYDITIVAREFQVVTDNAAAYRRAMHLFMEDSMLAAQCSKSQRDQLTKTVSKVQKTDVVEICPQPPSEVNL